MLKFLRQKGIQKKIYIFVAVAVVMTFVLSGILINKDNPKSAGELGRFEKRAFKVQDYLDSYRAVQRQAGFMYGDKLAELRARINFKGEAWDRLLLLEYAKKENIRASDQEVVSWITKQDGFKKDGKFDESFYKLFVERAMRSTPRQFEEEIRQMLTIGKIQENLSGKLNLTDQKLEELYRAEKLEKDIVYGVLPWEKLQSEITVQDKDIQQLYDIVKDKLTTPEKSKLKYILVPKASAETPAADTAAGDLTTLEDLSKKFNVPIQETGYFSKNEPDQTILDVPAALSFALASPAGQLSGWLEGSKGRYRMTVVDRQAERPMSLEEAKNEVTQLFKQQEATKLTVKRLQEIKVKMTSSADFEKILKENGVESAPVEKYKKGMYPAGIWPSENLFNAVAKLNESEISDAFEIPKGAMIVKVTKIFGFDKATFDKEKTEFRNTQKSKQSQEAMEKLLKTLRDKLQMNLELMKEIFPADEIPQK